MQAGPNSRRTYASVEFEPIGRNQRNFAQGTASQCIIEKGVILDRIPRVGLSSASHFQIRYRSLSAITRGTVIGASVVRRIELGERVNLNGAIEMAAVGTALHAVIAAELINPDQPDAEQCAEAIIAGAGLTAYLKADEAVACARRFHEWSWAQLGQQRILAEYPVSQRMPNGPHTRGWIDVLVETETGWVIVDHKSSPRPRTEWDADALA